MSNPDIISLYSNSQAGGELPYFVGKQYGSGWLRTIGRFALPILKRIGSFGMKTAQDVIANNGKILPTLKSNALAELGNVVSSLPSGVTNMIPKVANMLPSSITNRIPSEISNMITKQPQKVNKKRKKSKATGINKRMKGHGTIFENDLR